jgi:hypothetical protein
MRSDKLEKRVFFLFVQTKMPGCESFSSFSFESVISKEIHSLQGSAVECADEQNLDYDAIIAELQAQSKRISDAQKAVEGSHASLKRQVLVVS